MQLVESDLLSWSCRCSSSHADHDVYIHNLTKHHDIFISQEWRVVFSITTFAKKMTEDLQQLEFIAKLHTTISAINYKLLHAHICSYMSLQRKNALHETALYMDHMETVLKMLTTFMQQNDKAVLTVYVCGAGSLQYLYMYERDTYIHWHHVIV